METKSGVYQIINRSDPTKFYVGSTNDLQNRKRNHFSKLHRDKHPNPHLQSAWNKEGGENFTFEPMIFCGPEEALAIEQTLLNVLHPHYNTAVDATAPRKGLKHTEKTIRKQSEAKKGEKNPMWGKRAWNSGKTTSLEVRRKQSDVKKGEKNPFWGRQHTEKTKQKHSEFLKLYWRERRKRTNTENI